MRSICIALSLWTLLLSGELSALEQWELKQGEFAWAVDGRTGALAGAKKGSTPFLKAAADNYVLLLRDSQTESDEDNDKVTSSALAPDGKSLELVCENHRLGVQIVKTYRLMDQTGRNIHRITGRNGILFPAKHDCALSVGDVKYLVFVIMPMRRTVQSGPPAVPSDLRQFRLTPV